MTDNADFLFKPRNEAHPMRWDDLMYPVQSAVADLLIRLAGADQVNARNQGCEKFNTEVANCFLVYGVRGTGKTTVLHSAKKAIYNASETDTNHAFFPAILDKRTQAAKAASVTLGSKHIVWLPILDLEPLHANTNLLTTVLTHVRNALDQPVGVHKANRLSSIFEESADSARQQFTQLIHDATLIWEEINEVDTRAKASRQVAAADIYANFRSRFQKAMQALAEQLGQVYGIEAPGCSVVLPIDNIDRSTEHLYAMIKLAQLLLHSRLWLVLAGDRQDVESFLERAYWKELIGSKDGSGARGKKDGDGEDEVLVMARRQAAASYQKLLPPSHRIEVNCVDAQETLLFKQSPTDKSIYDLLNSIYVFRSENQADEGIEGHKVPFMDLLDAQKFIDREPLQVSQPRVMQTQNQFPYLTHFAKHGLNLPARAVLDLWLVAYCIVGDTETTKYTQAEKVARTMLRNAIFRSDMTSTDEHNLQDKIIGRNMEISNLRGTLLNFETIGLDIYPICTGSNFRPIHVLNTDKKLIPLYVSRSSLQMAENVDIKISLKEKYKGGINMPTHNLPEDVAAWLAILYDILMLVPRVAIISSVAKFSRMVKVTHEVSFLNSLPIVDKSQKNNDKSKKNIVSVWWPAPEWETFLGQDVFWQQWTVVQKIIYENTFKIIDKNLRIRFLLVSWIACIIKTFALLNHPNNDKTCTPHVIYSVKESEYSVKESEYRVKESEYTVKKSEYRVNEIEAATMLNNTVKQKIQEAITLLDNKTSGLLEAMNNDTEFEKKLDDYEQFISTSVHLLYEAINIPTEGSGLIEEKQMVAWMEIKLPLLFSDLYVPFETTELNPSYIFKKMCINGRQLNSYWIDNALFFLDGLDLELNQLFPKDTVMRTFSKTENKNPRNTLYADKEAYDKYVDSLGQFGQLHKNWNPDRNNADDQA